MSPHFRSLLELLRPFKARYALGGLFLACSDLGQLVIPQLVGEVIDGIAQGRMDAADVRHMALAIVAWGFFVAAVRYGWRIYVFGTARLVETQLRQRLVDHLQSLSTSFYSRQKVGDLMAHATNDVQAVRGAAGEGFMAGWDAVFMAAGATLMMVWKVDWRLALVSLAPLVLLPYCSFRLGQAVRVWYGHVQEAFSGLSEQVQESVAGVRVLKGFVREAHASARFAEANERYRRAFATLARYDVGFDPMINLLSGLAFAIGLGYGGHMVLAGTLTVGQYVAFNSFLAMLVWPMLALGWTMNLVQRASASMARLDKLFAERPEVSDGAEARPLVQPEGRIAVRDLSFRYAPETPDVLTGVSFELAPGKLVGVLGGTGAGKTTLANLMVRLYNPPRGQVFLDGVDLNDWAVGDVRRAIAYVPQDAFLFSRSVLENAAFDPAEHPEAAVNEAIAQAQLTADLAQFSQGAATMLGERGVTLSGGQRQRLSIARALVKEAPVLILDDCLSAVDTLTEARLLEALSAHAATRATLLISHRISALSRADEILVLSEGRVIERGDHAALVALDGEYARLHRKQQLEDAIERMG